MANHKKASDEDVLRLFDELGAKGAGEVLGITRQAVEARVKKFQAKTTTTEHSARCKLKVKDGTIVVGSDAHYWPGLPRSTAHSALVRLSAKLGPSAVILNGDIIDAPSVSKHAAIGWEKRPALWDEVLTARERLAEIEKVCGEHLIWTLGNHDARFETYLANVAHQYEGVEGIHLKDHFPSWTPAWSVWVNPDTDPVVVKHRIGRGERSLISNITKAGTHIVTSHTHAANVWAYTDYIKTLYGVDTGTMSVPYGPQFTNYTEDNPVNWRSSITVLTFAGGRLLPPEQLIVIDEEKRLTAFRGQIHQEEK